MARKTIAEHMRDVLIETENDAFMWGDCGLMDDCAVRATHTTLMDAHPLDRHKRIMDACERSTLFRKHLVSMSEGHSGHRGNPLWRTLTLIKAD